MVLRFLIRLLMNDKIINKLADSYPFRRAAKWVVYFLQRGKAIKADESISAAAKLNFLLKATEKIKILFSRQQTIHSSHPHTQEQVHQAEHNQKIRDTSEQTEVDASNRFRTKTQNSETHKEDELKKYVEELRRRVKD